MKKAKKIICLLLVFVLAFATISTEAAYVIIRWRITITTRRTIKNSGKRSGKISLSDKTVKIDVGEEAYIALCNASNAVKWSVSKKGIIKIKKDGSGVDFIGLKPGKCYLKAKYKGKIYKCKVTVKKIGKNIYFKERLAFDDSCLVRLYCKYPCIVSCFSENPSIASVGDGPQFTFTAEPDDTDPWDKWNENNIFITVHRPGNTRIIITNSYNQREVQYIYVTVQEEKNTNPYYIGPRSGLIINLQYPITMYEDDKGRDVFL